MKIRKKQQVCPAWHDGSEWMGTGGKRFKTVMGAWKSVCMEDNI